MPTSLLRLKELGDWPTLCSRESLVELFFEPTRGEPREDLRRGGDERAALSRM